MERMEATQGYGRTAQTDASWWPLRTVGHRPLGWLWPGRVPLGKVTLLVGDPGRGKSLLALDMAARVTRGAAWPDTAAGAAPQGSVVLLSVEDDAGDTLLPRLRAAGGDPERVIILNSLLRRSDNHGLTFSLSRDLPLLEAEMRAWGDVRLVILDPVTAYLGGAHGHSNAEVRELLAPLRALAERRQAAVVGVSHLTKRSDAALMYRAMGSLAFVAAARAVWAVGADRRDPGRMLFLPVKCNLAGRVTGLAYRIVGSAADPSVPVLAWDEEAVDVTAEEALEGRRRGSATELAAMWLQGLLAAGPRATRDVERLATAAGISPTALRKARKLLRVGGCPGGRRAEWVMQLPARGVAGGTALEGGGQVGAAETAAESVRCTVS